MFKPEDRVRGKAGTIYEFADCEVIENDNEGNMQIFVLEDELDSSNSGEFEWVDIDDFELNLNAPISSKMATPKPLNLEVDTDILVVLGIV